MNVIFYVSDLCRRVSAVGAKWLAVREHVELEHSAERPFADDHVVEREVTSEDGFAAQVLKDVGTPTSARASQKRVAAVL